MKKKKISVIVPVYNTAKYLEKCLDNLLSQTYKNIEIIVVEDCSTDNSKDVLKKYEKEDKVKMIYNEKNSGLSYSRNIGLKNSTGDYIGYIDSDDYVSSDFYEKLINSIQANNSEIAICDMKIVFEKTGIEQISKCYSEEFNLFNVVNNGLAASACNKLFKREIIEKYDFSIGKVNEDIAVVIPALVRAKEISYAEDCYYYYIQREGSIQNSVFSDKRFDLFYGVSLTLDRINESKEYNKLKDAIVYNQIIVLLLYVFPKEKNLKRRKYLLKRFNELSLEYNIRMNYLYLNFLKQCGKKHRIYYKLLFNLTCKKHYILANYLILTYDIVSKFLSKNTVLKKCIVIDDLINMAKKQHHMNIKDIKISVVIPNYNYSKFLYQRLYSVLSQNYKLHEILILDDNSSDDSIEVINNIVSKIDKYVDIKTIYNKRNSGSAFKQWELGIKHATGDYVWIAEADDYCSRKMLKKLINPLRKNKNIVISYCDTAFINETGQIILKSIKPEIDIMNTKHWDKNYINDGKNEFNNYTFLNCTIANVSSAIIKNADYSGFFDFSKKLKQAGDWVLYANIMHKGDIAYNKEVLNYYRVHGNNVSSVTKKRDHFNEINIIHKYYDEIYKLNGEQKKQIEKRYSFLKKVWNLK